MRLAVAVLSLWLTLASGAADIRPVPAPAAGPVAAPLFQPAQPAWQTALGGFLRHAEIFSKLSRFPSLDGWEMKGTLDPLLHHLQSFRSPEQFAALDAQSQRRDILVALSMAEKDLGARILRLAERAREDRLEGEDLASAAFHFEEIQTRYASYLLPHLADEAREAATLVHRRLLETRRATVDGLLRRHAPPQLQTTQEVIPVVVGEKAYFLSQREVSLIATRRRSLYYYNGISSRYGHDPAERLQSYLKAGGKLSPNGWKLRQLILEDVPRAEPEELTGFLRDALAPGVADRPSEYRPALRSQLEFIARHEPLEQRGPAAASALARVESALARFRKDVKDYKDAIWQVRAIRKRLQNTKRRYEQARWYPAAQAEMARLAGLEEYWKYFELRRLDFRGRNWPLFGREKGEAFRARREAIAALESGLDLGRAPGVRKLVDHEVERQETDWFSKRYNGLFKFKDDWFVWYAAGEPGISREHFGAVQQQFAKDGFIFEFRPESGERMWWEQMFHGAPEKVWAKGRVDKLTHDTVSPSGNLFFEELNRVYAATPELLEAARAAFAAAWGLRRLVLSGITFHLFDEQPVLYARDFSRLIAAYAKRPPEATLSDPGRLPAPARSLNPVADLADPEAAEQILAYLTLPEHFGMAPGTDLREAIGEKQFADWMELNKAVIAAARIGGPLAMSDAARLLHLSVRSTTRHQPVGYRTDPERHSVYPGGIAEDGLWTFSLAQASQFARNHRFRLRGRMVRRGTSKVGVEGLSYPEPEANIARRVYEIVQAYNRAAAQGVDPVAAAAILQRDIISLHPLTDGNGRASRALMDLELLKRGLLPPHLPDTDADLHMAPERYAEYVREAVAKVNSAD